MYAGLYGVHLLLMLRFLVTLSGQGDTGSLSTEGIVHAGHRYLLQKNMGKRIIPSVNKGTPAPCSLRVL